jgi:hypothetical protein
MTGYDRRDGARQRTEIASLATITWRIAGSLLCLIPLALATGCGGGGGGGGSTGSATVTGRILLVSTAQAPDPVATVTIGGASTTTGTSGTFTLTNVSTKATTVKIVATGETTLTQALPTLTDGATTDLGDIYLCADTYTASMTGTVVSADTLDAISGATVRINGFIATTAGNGSFTITGLPIGLGSGSAQVGVIKATGYDDKYLTLDYELDSGANNIGQIVMSPPVTTVPGGPKTLDGTVTLQGSSDATDTEVEILNSTGTVLGTYYTSSDGAFAFWVGKGTYTLRFTATGYSLKTVDVTITNIATVKTVNVTLTP